MSGGARPSIASRDLVSSEVFGTTVPVHETPLRRDLSVSFYNPSSCKPRRSVSFSVSSLQRVRVRKYRSSGHWRSVQCTGENLSRTIRQVTLVVVKEVVQHLAQSMHFPDRESTTSLESRVLK